MLQNVQIMKKIYNFFMIFEVEVSRKFNVRADSHADAENIVLNDIDNMYTEKKLSFKEIFDIRVKEDLPTLAGSD